MQAPQFDPDLIDEQHIKNRLAQARELADALADQKPAQKRIEKQIDTLDALTRKLDEAAHLAEVGALAHTDDEDALRLQKTAQKTARDIHDQLLAFTLALARDENLEAYAQQLPRYKYFFEQLAKDKDHLLEEHTEKLLSLKDRTGQDVIQRVYNIITSGYTYEIEVDGELKQVSRGALTNYLQSPDRDLRRRAREALIKPVTEDKLLLSEIYRSVVDEWRNENVQLRGHKDPIAVRHHNNDISDQTYHALSEAVRKKRSVFNDFLEKKKTHLGYDELYGYDLYAPLGGLATDVSYQDATTEVLESFRSLADWMHDNAKRVLESGRVDAQTRNNKYPGACCLEVAPGETPVILANYNGTYDDISTLAHELGHAVHDLLAAEHSALVFKPPLVLAETASNIAETLLFEHRYEHADEQERRALLDERLTGLLASIPTQMRYTHFEEHAHEHQDASLEELAGHWAALADEDLPAVKRENDPYYWLAIPHIFHSPFYCYSYAFGALLSISVYENYKQSGDAEPVRELLAAGGSENPEQLLLRLGYDVTSEEFWNTGLDRIQRLVEKF